MITQERVKELFTYDPNSGVLVNRIGRRKAIKGSTVGCLNSNKYLTVKIKNKTYRVHRIIFLYHHGYLPKFVDHADGNKTNNKISNLRRCSSSQNNSNKKTPKNNKSGFKGVSWRKKQKLWGARLMTNGVIKDLGVFYDPEVAAQVLRIYRLKAHGEFANHG